MLYRKVKKTGDELSILGFGAMRLPSRRGRIDEERATRQLRNAIDRGVNYVDTAFIYHGGASESFLGRALDEGYRDKVKIATKLPSWSVKAHRDMDLYLGSQLEKLKTDHIDYYLLHSLNRKTWARLDRLGARSFLDEAKADGRILNAGFSFHGDREAFKEIIDAYDWDMCQIQWNILDECNQAGTEGLEHAASKGMAVIVMEPLRGGNLSLKVPPAVRAIYDEAPVRRSAAAWALRWVWNHPGVTCVLSGMNEEAHIDENLSTAEEAHASSLTNEELSLMARVREVYQTMTLIDCTGCRYCMPCPAGVDIPMCFDIANVQHMFGGFWSRFRYPLRLDGFTEEPAFASLCEGCGKCMKKCPQGLPIPDLLREVARDFERPWLRPVIWAFKNAMTVQRWVALRAAGRDERRRGSSR